MPAMPEIVPYKVPNLDDPGLFWKRKGVPILDTHLRSYPPRSDGGVRRPDVFDDARLERIAYNSNRRAAEGDYAVLRIGHINYDRSVPEEEQPEPIGFARNFRTARLVNDQGGVAKPGVHIVADFYYYASIPKSKVESYPHRSVELDVADDFIDGVSLLRRPSERPLGILTYARHRPTAPSRRRVTVADVEREMERLGRSQAAMGRKVNRASATLAEVRHVVAEAQTACRRGAVADLRRRGADIGDAAAESLAAIPDRATFARAVASHRVALEARPKVPVPYVRERDQRLYMVASRLAGSGVPAAEALRLAKAELKI